MHELLNENMIAQQIIIYTEKTAMILMYMWKDSIDKKK